MPADYGWVFLGDILAPPINSRGEPADLGNPPGADRADLIDSNGAPGFIVNEVNLTLNGALARACSARRASTSCRARAPTFASATSFDVDSPSWSGWSAASGARRSSSASSIRCIGIEYQVRKANQRFGITPSLIARYTSARRSASRSAAGSARTTCSSSPARVTNGRR
jgi:hypothetical protein